MCNLCSEFLIDCCINSVSGDGKLFPMKTNEEYSLPHTFIALKKKTNKMSTHILYGNFPYMFIDVLKKLGIVTFQKKNKVLLC